jgi:hypothetical protein
VSWGALHSGNIVVNVVCSLALPQFCSSSSDLHGLVAAIYKTD